ncbi:sensor histidine kinase [Agreia sp. COWG]|uniref:sensor histidine kinase n=1 Tax=Agreia sp. COWG TaxID=2773266 RepID=UPI001F026561|nr:histidine kinase [Agreia sp. COWG]
MTEPSAPGSTAETTRRPVAPTARGVVATWWYTASAIVMFEVVIVLIWLGIQVQMGGGTPALLVLLVAGVLWIGSTLPLVRSYRHRTGETKTLPGRHVLLPLLVAAAAGAAAFWVSGFWLMLVLPLAQSLQLLDWPRPVRSRMVVVVTALLLCLWLVDVNGSPMAPVESASFLFGFYSSALPLMTVLSLWWWDVLIALDRARVSESRLAAAQERLSVATDVHDLQGHHLQVIALQLELAERLLPTDPDAALAQLRGARTSVDEARQGTRDLATRFRSVPLPDEIANARDLLGAAGMAAQAHVSPDAVDAPASIFGPVIRETTTNVLRHGGGRRATLELVRSDGQWRYEIRNDLRESDAAPDVDGRGSGLDGIARRVGAAGGSLTVATDGGDFCVVVSVPAENAGRS